MSPTAPEGAERGVTIGVLRVEPPEIEVEASGGMRAVDHPPQFMHLIDDFLPLPDLRLEQLAEAIAAPMLRHQFARPPPQRVGERGRGVPHIGGEVRPCPRPNALLHRCRSVTLLETGPVDDLVLGHEREVEFKRPGLVVLIIERDAVRLARRERLDRSPIAQPDQIERVVAERVPSRRP